MSEDPGFTVTLEQEDDYTFRIRFHDTRIPPLHTDESPPLGGGTGPDPSRLLAAAVANCLTASLLFALRKFKNQPGPLTTTASVRMGRNEHGRLRVAHIHADIRLAEAAGRHEHLDRLLAQFEDFCVVTQSVRHGIEVSVGIRDADGVQLHGTPPPAD